MEPSLPLDTTECSKYLLVDGEGRKIMHELDYFNDKDLKKELSQILMNKSLEEDQIREGELDNTIKSWNEEEMLKLIQEIEKQRIPLFE